MRGFAAYTKGQTNYVKIYDTCSSTFEDILALDTLSNARPTHQIIVPPTLEYQLGVHPLTITT